MAKTYYPFDGGAGYEVRENQWSEMARMFLRTGILAGIGNELQTYADSSGMQVKVKTGAGWIKGHRFESDAEFATAIAASDSTNPRIDNVVLQVDWANNNMDVVIVTGTPAASPVAPALVQTTAIKWQIKIAQVAVAAGATGISAGDVTDYRTFAQTSVIPIVFGNGIDTIGAGRIPVGFPVPLDCRIYKWELVGNVAGSVTVDIWKATYAQYVPTVANTIISTGKPTLSSSIKNTASVNNTTWPGRQFNAGEYIMINVDPTPATLTQATLSLFISPIF